jgi:hypothetical protein
MDILTTLLQHWVNKRVMKRIKELEAKMGVPPEKPVSIEDSLKDAYRQSPEAQKLDELARVAKSTDDAPPRPSSPPTDR